MILKLIKLYIVEVTRLLSQKNHSICLCRFKVISIFVKFIGNFLTLLRQSWPLMLGHLTLPTPLNQCCNQTWYAMKFARRVHSNATLKGGEGRMEIEYLKKTELCTSVPTIFVQDCRPRPFKFGWVSIPLCYAKISFFCPASSAPLSFQ